MDWYSLFYLLGVADKVEGIFLGLAIFATAASLIFLLAYLVSNSDYNTFKIFTSSVSTNKDKTEIEPIPKANNKFRVWWFTFILFTFIFWSIYAFIPNRRDIILIAAGGGIMTFLSQDSTAAQISANITKFLNTTLTSEIARLDKDTREEMGMLTPKEQFLDKAKQMTKDELINYMQSDTTLLKQ